MRIFFLTCLSLLLSAALPLHAEQWLIDAESSCKVWSPVPIAETQTITYTVKCVNGKAQGKGSLTVYDNGQKSRYFEGEFVDGKWQRGKGAVSTYENGVQVTYIHEMLKVHDTLNEI